MTQKMSNWRMLLVRELVVALGVLALVFLSFSHQTINVQASDKGFVLADGSMPVFCGSPPEDGSGQKAHRSCDACRIAAGIALPQTSTDCAERFVLVARADVVGIEFAAHVDFINQASRSRAPPFA